jgi:hypothetical protein
MPPPTSYKRGIAPNKPVSGCHNHKGAHISSHNNYLTLPSSLSQRRQDGW